MKHVTNIVDYIKLLYGLILTVTSVWNTGGTGDNNIHSVNNQD